MTDLRKRLPCTVNVLGTEYSISIRNKNSDAKLETLNGYTDATTKEIVLHEIHSDTLALSDQFAFQIKVARHEIIHAFLHESGLDYCSSGSDSWAINEEMVDWFAIQSPKIFKVYKELEIL